MTSTQPQQLEKASGHARRLLAVLVGLLVSLALIVSGAAPALAQNAVGAQHQNLILAVGSQTLAAQTSIGADGLAQLRHVSATGVAANTVRTFGQFGAADIRAAAGAADRNGLTRVGRALQKHSGREGGAFYGSSSGTAVARNEQGMRVLDDILGDAGGRTEVLNNVTNVWDSTGRGIRLGNDGTFMGFLEPLP